MSALVVKGCSRKVALDTDMERREPKRTGCRSGESWPVALKMGGWDGDEEERMAVCVG